ncbi:MAG: efflux RND transporter periplasmic adaptor subunit, partial [Muribaculaceae bacterium]|nr:efflux RND transporter periplasmic adaptor subunit [Muribaculaceae bacterium]
MKTNTISIAALAMAGAAMMLASCGGKEQAAQGAGAPPEIAVITVEPGNAEFQSSYPATVKGKTDIDIRPQVTGFITKVHVD